MKGWHLAIAVAIAIAFGYFAGVKFPMVGNKLLAKAGV